MGQISLLELTIYQNIPDAQAYAITTYFLPNQTVKFRKNQKKVTSGF